MSLVVIIVVAACLLVGACTLVAVYCYLRRLAKKDTSAEGEGERTSPSKYRQLINQVEGSAETMLTNNKHGRTPNGSHRSAYSTSIGATEASERSMLMPSGASKSNPSSTNAGSSYQTQIASKHHQQYSSKSGGGSHSNRQSRASTPRSASRRGNSREATTLLTNSDAIGHHLPTNEPATNRAIESNGEETEETYDEEESQGPQIATAVIQVSSSPLNKAAEGGSSSSETGFNSTSIQKKYKVKKMVGEGAFASVHHATRLEDDRDVAIKIIACKNEKETVEAMNEYRLCCHVQGHTNVIQVHEVFLDACDPASERVRDKEDPSSPDVVIGSLTQLSGLNVPFGFKYLCIVSDFYPEGTLFHLLLNIRCEKVVELRALRKLRSQNPSAPVSFVRGLAERKIWSYSIQLLAALNHLHSQNLLHRDLKPGNVLMADNAQRLILTDFGLSRFLESGEYAKTQAGTLHYVSPEQVQRHYTKKSDLWGMGCLVYNMCTLRITRDDARVMFQDSTNPNFFHEVRMELRGYSEHLVKFLFRLLNRKYKDRPSASEGIQICREGLEALDRREQRQREVNNNNPAAGNRGPATPPLSSGPAPTAS